MDPEPVWNATAHVFVLKRLILHASSTRDTLGFGITKYSDMLRATAYPCLALMWLWLRLRTLYKKQSVTLQGSIIGSVDVLDFCMTV